MLKKAPDHERMRVAMDKLIARLELPELNKQFLRALTTIVGGVIVPALVSLNVAGGARGNSRLGAVDCSLNGE